MIGSGTFQGQYTCSGENAATLHRNHEGASKTPSSQLISYFHAILPSEQEVEKLASIRRKCHSMERVRYADDLPVVYGGFNSREVH